MSPKANHLPIFLEPIRILNSDRLLVLICFLLICPWLAKPAAGQDMFVYENESIKHIIQDIEEREGFRFLYRDALIADKYISFRASEDSLFSALKETLYAQHLDIKVDYSHQQVLLSSAATPTSQSNKSATIKGVILDKESGIRLPFANVTWVQDGHLYGVSTDDAGHFRLVIPENTVSGNSVSGNHVLLNISYVGYKPEQIRINLNDVPAETSIRLAPISIQGNEVLIQSSILHTDLDTTWHHLLNAGLFSPFGESSILRSLQPLPAVSFSSALSNGLNVRGSKSDGFQVLLDGAPIYNQNHLYGLFDVFNEDVLQTVGFFYDITPARYFAPPGGTISFITRPGSLSNINGSVGISNTAIRASLEGPFVEGKSSWLVSGRLSYLDQISWLNNNTIVDLGLNINRPFSQLPNVITEFANFVYTPQDASAQFFDIHAKNLFETPGGGRVTLSLYAGGNNTQLDAIRLTSVRQQANGTLDPETMPVSTNNKWGNEAASLQINHTPRARATSTTSFAFSHYLSSFSKDDFTYARINPNTGRSQNFIFPFENRNEVLDTQIAHHVNVSTQSGNVLSLGAESNFYALTYREQSARFTEFNEDYYAIKTDLYGEYDFTSSNVIHIRSGMRFHHFTQGNAFNVSPRFQLSLLPKARIGLKVGYSHNYQYLHQLYLDNANSASIWVITTGASKPSQVRNLTLGLYFKPTQSLSFQVEGYDRYTTHLRRHEINAPIQNATNAASNFQPWLTNTKAYAQGLEFMLNKKWGPVTWTHSYTLSSVELQNDQVLGGKRYPAEWDQTHQYSSNLQINLSRSLVAGLSWYFGSGKTNTLAYTESEHEEVNRIPETERLPDYHRLDASLKASFVTGPKNTLNLKLSVYNLYDRENVWYREPIQVFRTNRPSANLRFYNVDIYDLPLQPAFDVSFVF